MLDRGEDPKVAAVVQVITTLNADVLLLTGIDYDLRGAALKALAARLAAATHKNSVPRKARYFLGCRKPTSSLCPVMPVTTISSRFCHRER